MRGGITRQFDEALAPGADLWVVGDLESSSWSRRIDWYLNFQILRSRTHRTAPPGEEMKRVLSKWDVEIPPVEDMSAWPLMVVSSSNLPNHAVLMVPFENNDARRWAERVHGIWSGLDSPSLRIFLPDGLDAAKFAKAWPGSADALAEAVVSQATSSEAIDSGVSDTKPVASDID